jgi:hypothetical protein
MIEAGILGKSVFTIEAPGALDGGDVLRVGRTVYVGLSSRSNRAGVEQLQGFLAPYDYTVKASGHRLPASQIGRDTGKRRYPADQSGVGGPLDLGEMRFIAVDDAAFCRKRQMD